MAARTTMAWLITRVRQLIRDTDSVLFTDDEDIEDVLDSVSWRIRRQKLVYATDLKLYLSADRDFEGTVETGTWTGTANPEIICIYDGRAKGASAVTPNTWNLRRGSFGFTTAQTDRSYYLDAWVHDPYVAASILCEELVLEPTITPGAGETGGATVGRYDYERMAKTRRARGKARPIEIKRARRNDWANT